MIEDYLNLPQVQFLIEHWYLLPVLFIIFAPLFVLIDNGIDWFKKPNSNVSPGNLLVNSDLVDISLIKEVGMLPTIKPCPFCDSDMVETGFGPQSHKGDNSIYVFCWNCSATGPERKSEYVAIYSWNCRPAKKIVPMKG